MAAVLSLEDAGDQLLSLAAKATESVTLVAPFVKVAAISRVLQAVDSSVPVRLYTSWRPDILVSGASDLDVWPLMEEREPASVYLCNNLHAKCYVFDAIAALGSANLTLSALQWRPNPNLELQVLMSVDEPEVKALMERLQVVSRLAGRSEYEKLCDLVQELKAILPSPPFPTLTDTPAAWLPRTRHPPSLLMVYSGELEDVTHAAADTASDDLADLGIPAGLSAELFNTAVATVISQMAFFQKVDELSLVPRRFGEYRELTRDFLQENNIARDPADAWQTCLRWLTYFLNDRYELESPELPKYSEILRRREPPNE